MNNATVATAGIGPGLGLIIIFIFSTMLAILFIMIINGVSIEYFNKPVLFYSPSDWYPYYGKWKNNSSFEIGDIGKTFPNKDNAKKDDTKKDNTIQYDIIKDDTKNNIDDIKDRKIYDTNIDNKWEKNEKHKIIKKPKDDITNDDNKPSAPPPPENPDLIDEDNKPSAPPAPSASSAPTVEENDYIKKTLPKPSAPTAPRDMVLANKKDIGGNNRKKINYKRRG